MFLAQNYLTRGFWGDEAWTSLISQLPYKEMLKTTAADFHPPGFYTIVGLVYKILPPTEIVTRSISIIFYLLTIFMVFKLASYVRGRQFGLLAAAFVALNPVFFRYAFEARNYTMFGFAATGSIYCLIRLSSVLSSQFSESSSSVDRSVSSQTDKPKTDKLISENRKQRTDNWKMWALAFIFFTTLGIYTHYYMFFVLGAQGLYLLLFDRKIFLKMMGLYVAVGVLYLPWIPFLARQLNSVAGDYWIGGIDKRTHYEAFLRILGGENKNAIRPLIFAVSIILLVVGLIQHVANKPEKGSGQHFEKPYLLTWLWAIVPFILATLPGFKIDGIHLHFRPIFFWRYLIGSSVPLAMVMVHTAQKFPKYLMWVSVGSVIVLSLVVDVLTFGRVPYSFREAYREKVVAQIKPGDKIVTVLPSFAEVAYYRNRLGLNNDLVVLPEGLVQFSGKSLLDAYVENGVVTISDETAGRYFEMRPGPTIDIVD